jgi:hypothetical protein
MAPESKEKEVWNRRSSQREIIAKLLRVIGKFQFHEQYTYLLKVKEF